MLITSREIYFLKSVLCNKPFYTIFPLGFPSCQPMDFNSSPFVFFFFFGKGRYTGQKRWVFHSLLNLISCVCIFQRCKFHGLEGNIFHSKAFYEMIGKIAKTIQEWFGRCVWVKIQCNSYLCILFKAIASLLYESVSILLYSELKSAYMFLDTVNSPWVSWTQIPGHCYQKFTTILGFNTGH